MLVGINYKDQATNALRFLERFGNPYSAVGVDAGGRAAIEWGVYGVPETFLVGRDGRIAYKQIGPIADEATFKRVQTEIEKALGG
jgi:cytochrome c biogenesis protein CcmG/thiol:disulfide interchange protein DsbE